MRSVERPVSRRASRAVAWLLEHRVWILLLAGILGLLAVPRTAFTYMALQSDLEELLPKNAPSVEALREFRARMPGMRYLGVVVDTGSPQSVPHALRFLDDLAERVERYPEELAEGVRTGVREERIFAETYALQLMDLSDVRKLKRSILERRDWEVTRSLDLGLLDEEEDPPPNIPIRHLREKYEARYGAGHRFPDDRFVDEAGQTAVLLIRSSSTSTGAGPDRKLLRQVQADISDLGFPARYAPGMQLGFAGDVAARVEEMSGLQADLMTSALIVMVLISLLLTWFFGSVWALPILGIPLLLGTSCAFGLVALPPFSIRHLNSNTAFLGVIVIGNGINTGIILLSRIQEERRLGASLEAAIVQGVSRTWGPTLAAASAAAAAYGSLVFTDFRGFNQFGWIGGLGMLICWGTTLALGPLLLASWGHHIPIPNPRYGRGHGRQLLLSLLKRPWAVLTATALLCGASVWGIQKRSGTWMEYDFSKLRRADSWISGERYWGPRMNQTLGRYLTPTVVLTQSADAADVVRERVEELKQTGGAGGLIHSVRTASDVLRPEREETAREVAEIAELLTPRMLRSLKPEDRDLVRNGVSEAAQTPLLPEQLPEPLVMGLREFSGRMDRNVLVFPVLEAGTWQSKPMAAFTRDLREAATVEGDQQPVAGSILIASDITETMRRDGPRATLIALGAVLLVCLIAFRRPGRESEPASLTAPASGSGQRHQPQAVQHVRQPLWLSLVAVSSVFLGVVLMMGMVAWSGERLNFTNFVALPMTFGIGADYAINMLRRWQNEAHQDMSHALASTGGAIALCSLTTIIGFGSLLVAQNRMLFSFGVLVVAGMVACLATATLVLPNMLALFTRSRTNGAGPAS